MSAPGGTAPGSAPLPERCWTVIGVEGDGTCGRLPELVHCRNCAVFSEAGRALLDREPPAGYVDEWTRVLAEAKDEGPVGTFAAAVFRVGDEWLALEAGAVVKFAFAREVRRVPHRSGPVFLGLVNVDGELLLCASLTGALSLPEAADPSRAAPPGSAARLVVASRGAERWVFPVDEVDGVLSLDDRALGEIPATLSHAPANHCRGLVRAEDGRTLAVLDAGLLFDSLRESLSP